jgi:virginiamycin B lyase
MIRRVALLSCFLVAGCSTAGSTLPPGPARLAAPAVRPHAISEFALVRAALPNPAPYQIVKGPDGAMWFTEEGAGAVGRIDARGRVRQFALTSANAQPMGIALGADGALYVAENEGPNPYATHFARLAPSGAVREWNDSNYMPVGAAAGPGGRMWFTQSCAGVASISRSGNVRQFAMPTVAGESEAIVAGPDSAMWFAQDGTASIGRIAPDGTLATYPGIFYNKIYNDVPHGAAVGSDGNVWWTALASNAIWAMSPSGKVVHVYRIPTAGAQPWGIAAGPDGALWFTEYGGGKIGRVTTSGAFSEYAIPTRGAKPQGLAFDAKGMLWFVESGANKIGRIAP